MTEEQVFKEQKKAYAAQLKEQLYGSKKKVEVVQ